MKTFTTLAIIALIAAADAVPSRKRTQKNHRSLNKAQVQDGLGRRLDKDNTTTTNENVTTTSATATPTNGTDSTNVIGDEPVTTTSPTATPTNGTNTTTNGTSTTTNGTSTTTSPTAAPTKNGTDTKPGMNNSTEEPESSGAATVVGAMVSAIAVGGAVLLL
eukprot:CAMPEP_0172546886 /NCGR_PEP_ID=MMETSP1067-20121228/16549_1 /TAXON_ID=265564 ORGANISM="Thalassiosira punctigera, Strain Tpunct2005C2" /NCGR_SAMPLE_ID=MMETSP1067 /ASSEMBLY_ACC=CAM_ASM_000444 /LENGTH=161 /DNA_ID=CAMNT_0013333881 /DNA_START=85 /DNA_END=570 /DNA_ORIENTATION=+